MIILIKQLSSVYVVIFEGILLSITGVAVLVYAAHAGDQDIVVASNTITDKYVIATQVLGAFAIMWGMPKTLCGLIGGIVYLRNPRCFLLSIFHLGRGKGRGIIELEEIRDRGSEKVSGKRRNGGGSRCD